MLKALVREARPKQWVKNVLVFAAPGAAGVLDDVHEIGWTVLMFVALTLAAAGTYYWNDLLDLEADRAHPSPSRGWSARVCSWPASASPSSRAGAAAWPSSSTSP
jgi:decaprenyl-phosphate phosphoribosyltransferase